MTNLIPLVFLLASFSAIADENKVICLDNSAASYNNDSSSLEVSSESNPVAKTTIDFQKLTYEFESPDSFSYTAKLIKQTEGIFSTLSKDDKEAPLETLIVSQDRSFISIITPESKTPENKDSFNGFSVFTLSCSPMD